MTSILDNPRENTAGFTEISPELSPASFARFAAFITAELGIKMPPSKATLVHSRLLRRVRELRLASVEQYAEYFFASVNSAEREQFINVITTNKTDFFREPEHFAFLRGVILPEWDRAGHGVERFKAWSAGCSSGEEPYTLAMVLAEHSNLCSSFDFAVLGTDVSTKMLATARNGIYQEAEAAPVPPGYRKKYLLHSRNAGESLIRITPALRGKVSFHQLNFMDEQYGIKDLFDVIFFRNVMIYFDRSTQAAVVNRLLRHLAPGGYLFAGHSESLAGLDLPIEPVMASVFRKPAE